MVICVYSFYPTKFCIDGKAPVISCDVLPPFDVSKGELEIGLKDLSTYYSFPNIDSSNNKFYYGDKVITIPEGAYEIENLEDTIKSMLGKDVEFSLKPNNNTLKSEIFCSKKIDFTKDQTIGPLLGFESKILDENVKYVSDTPVNILKVNVIRVECNIARGSYRNGEEGHVIYDFFPDVGPGYKIIERPRNIVYLPLTVNSISHIVISLRDQDDQLINFRGETLSVTLHVRQRHGYSI